MHVYNLSLYLYNSLVYDFIYDIQHAKNFFFIKMPSDELEAHRNARMLIALSWEYSCRIVK